MNPLHYTNAYTSGKGKDSLVVRIAQNVLKNVDGIALPFTEKDL